MKRYKRRQTDFKILNTIKKEPRNSQIRIRSTERSNNDNLENVNKKFSRALSSGFKYQVKNKLSEKMVNSTLSDKNNILKNVDKPQMKKK